MPANQLLLIANWSRSTRGQEWTIFSLSNPQWWQVRADIKALVLSFVNAESTDVSCGQARASKWHKLKKCTTQLPPDDDSESSYGKDKLPYKLPVPLQPARALLSHWPWLGTRMNGKCWPVRHTLPPCPSSLYLMTAQMRVAVTMRGVRSHSF